MTQEIIQQQLTELAAEVHLHHNCSYLIKYSVSERVELIAQATTVARKPEAHTNLSLFGEPLFL